MTAPEGAVLWASWWCNPWPWADRGWQVGFAEQHGLPLEDCQLLLGSRPRVFLQSLGIVPSQPPSPNACALRWLGLDERQRTQLLQLVHCICFAQGPEPGPEGQWCWGLSQALRPGRWLPAEMADARLLLGAWLGQACWSRLRLSWPPGELAEELAQAPEHKLQALWQAAFWRVGALTDVESDLQ